MYVHIQSAITNSILEAMESIRNSYFILERAEKGRFDSFKHIRGKIKPRFN